MNPDRGPPDRSGRGTCGADRRPRRRSSPRSPFRRRARRLVTAPSFTRTRSHVRARADLRARLASRPRAMARVTAPGPPTAVTLLPPGTGSIAAAEQQHGAGACGPRSHRRCRRSRARRRSLQEIGLEPLGHQIGDRHRSPAQQANASFLPSARNRRPVFSSVPQLARRRRVDRRRRHLEQVRETRRAGRASRRTRVLVGVLRPRTARIASAVRCTSVEKTSGRPSGASETSRGSGRTNCTPRRSSCMSRTIDGRSGPKRVRERRRLVARRELLGRRAAADDRPTLEDERLCVRPSRDRRPRRARCDRRR